MNKEIAKWAPFNAVIDGKAVIKDICDEKNKVFKPSLTDEQIEKIEQKIISSYTSKIYIKILYYYNYKINEIDGFITKIDTTNKTITLNNKNIFFTNIVDIKENI